MTNQEASKIIKDGLDDMSIDYTDEEQQEALTMAIKALEQEPSGDLISRQLAIDTMTKLEQEDIDTYGCSIPEGFDGERAIEALKQLPPVKPQEPKTGHWIPTYGNVKCSVCGSVKESRRVGKATHYCDFCGARMESEGEEC